MRLRPGHGRQRSSQACHTVGEVNGNSIKHDRASLSLQLLGWNLAPPAAERLEQIDLPLNELGIGGCDLCIE